MHQKTILKSLAVISASALLFTACGTPAEPEEPTEPVSLRMSLWSSNEAHLALFQGFADEFVAENPDLVSDIEIAPTAAGENYRTVITTQIGGGDAPDLGWLGSSDAIDFAGQGALVDLQPTLDAYPDWDQEDLMPAAMAQMKQGDNLWGIPFSTSPTGIFYNADLFAAAGIPNPDEMIEAGDWTWDNLAAAAATIKQVTGAWGFNIGPYAKFDTAWTGLNDIWAPYGAEPWSADGAECKFTEPEMTDAMTFLHDMIYKTGGYPTPGTVPDFPTGQIAMTSTYISTANTLKEVPFGWGLVPPPSGPEGRVSSIGQSEIVAFAAGKNHDAAAQFIAFMLTKDNAAKLAQFFPSARQSLNNSETLAAVNPVLSEAQLQAVVVEGVENGKLAPGHTDQGEIAEIVRADLEAFWNADADFEPIGEKICEDIAPLLQG